MFFLLMGLGAVAGFLAGLLGIGGGIILVPGFLFIFHMAGFESASLIHVCVGTSLAAIIPNSIMSAYSHWRRGGVDFSLVRDIGVGLVAGVAAGTMIAGYLPGAALVLVFSCALSVLAVMMVVNPARNRFFPALRAQPWPGLAGMGIGTISTMIGIGGGSLSVPFMSLCGLPVHRAIGTSAALGLVIAVPAAIGFVLIGWGMPDRPPFSLGYINIPAWAAVLPSSLLFVRAGVRVAHGVSVRNMRRIFALFLLVVALKMWVGAF
ncbi:MAG: sulfite exporter TauE/SafE family protein [Alphaproteobacteria bacterium]|nr:sulfite exporter TauE/SafE family protein [Alphaproteobacteria bacterium]